MNRPKNEHVHFAAAFALVAFGCSDSSSAPPGGGGGAGGAAGSAAATLVVETFGTNLFGADGAYETERRPAILAAIAASDADVLCLTDVVRDEDKSAIADAAKAGFPHSFWVKHAAKDVAPDETLEDGSIPILPTSPPCATKAQRTALEAGIACAEMQCSSIPSDPTGHVTELDCVAAQCASPLLPLIAGTADDRRCGSCFEANLTSYKSWSEIATRCEDDADAGFVFDGQTDVLLLSRRPLEAPESVVLPSSLFRREILRAHHPAGLDVYCLHLQTVFLGPLVVYPGPWAPGLAGQAAWAAENHLQASKLLAVVAAKTGTAPAVLLGNFESSVAASRNGVELVSANGGAGTLALLTPTPFLEGVAPDYVPACTECPENVLAAIAAPGMWTEHVLLSGLPGAAVHATTRGFLDVRVPVATASGMMQVPLSSHWSLRSVLALH